METTDITGLNETIDTSPEQAIENLNIAQETQLNPDSVAQESKPLKTVQKAPKQATPVVAESMMQSRQVASAVSPDVPKISDAEAFGTGIRLTTEQSDISTRRAELAWKVRELEINKKSIPEELTMELDILRMNYENNAKQLEGLDQGLLAKGTTAMISSWRDTFKSAINNPELVLPATGGGALLGLGGGTAIPFVGNFFGTVGGAATGALTSAMAANAWDNIKRTRGEMYDDLSVAMRDNVPLNMSPESKSAIANSVGFISGALEFAGEKFVMKHIPGMKRLFDKKTITKEIVRNPKLANALVGFGKAIGVGMAEEGFVEGLQENMQIFAEELTQTWNGKETSLPDAVARSFDNLLTKGYWKRVGEAAAVGAIAGGGSVAAIAPVSSTVAKVHDSIANKVKPGAKATDDIDTTVVLPEAAVPTEAGKIVTEQGVPKFLNPQQALTLGLVLQNTSEIVNEESKIGGAPVDAVEIQRKMLKESGVREVWYSGADIEKWADTEAKRLKVREWFGDVDFDLDARVPVDPQVALEMIRQDPSFAKTSRPTAEGMSFNEVLEYYKDRPDRINRDLLARGVPAATAMQEPVEATGEPVPLEQPETPPTAGLGPSSTDEDIIATLGTKQEANAYLARLADEESRLFTEGDPETLERLSNVQQMRERVQSLTESLPDQPVDLNPENDITFDEEVELAMKEYMTRPLHTDLIRAGVPSSVVKALESEYMNIRSEIVTATKEAAYQEMQKVAEITDEMLKTEEAIESIEQSVNDPNIEIVEMFLNNTVELQINPDFLTPEQRSRYLDSVVLSKRKVFNKKGIHSPDTLADVLGVADGDAILDILENIPTLDQAFKNAEALTNTAIDPEALTSVDPNNAAIIKAITNKQMMNMKEFNALIESSWAKARRGIEGTVFAKPDMDRIRQDAVTKINSIPLNKLNPNSYRLASVRAGIKKVKAALRGDFLEASRQREVELRADESYKQALIAVGKSNKFIKKMARWMRNPTIQTALRESKMLDGFNEFNDIINLDPAKGKGKRDAFEALVKRFAKDQTIDLAIPKEVIDGFDPRATPNELSFDQLSYIYNKNSQIIKLAMEYSKVKGEQGEIYIKDVSKEVTKELQDHPDRDEKKLDRGNQIDFSAIRKLKAMMDSVALYMPNINYITMRLAQGNENSFIRKFIYDQLKGVGAFDNGYGEKATNAERAKMRKRQEELLDKTEGRKKRITDYGKTIITPAQWEDSVNLLSGGRMTKLQLMTMVAYYGSETGRQRLSNFGINPDSVLEVADTYLTKDDIDYIQEAVWDSFDLMKPRLKRMLEQINGEDITWVEGKGFDLFGKSYTGGYIPLRYRTGMTIDQMIEEDKQRVAETLGLTDSAPINLESSKGFTIQGHRESRVEEFTGILNLDFNNVVTIGMENVITDVTMFPAIKNIMDVLKQKEVATEMTMILGIDGFKEFKNHILGSARSIYSERAQISSELAGNWRNSVQNIANKYVKNTLIGVPSTILMQLSSGAYAWSSQGVGSTAEYAWNFAKLSVRPWQWQEMMRLAAQYDSSIGNYIDNVDESTKGGVSTVLPTDLYVGGDNLAGKLSSKAVSAINKIEQVQTAVFLNGLLGIIDVALKVPAAITIHNRFLKGKVKGFDVKTLAKMSPEQIENEARAYTTRILQATLTASSNLEKAKAQKDTWIKDWARYFNDARNIYNYTMFNTVTKTKWALNKARKQSLDGDLVGAGLTMFGAAQGVIAMQMYTMVAATMINIARGEDDEGEELPPFLTSEWEKKVVITAFDNFINPLLMPKTMTSAIPIFRDVAFNIEMRDETGNRFVTLIAPMHISAINQIAAGLHSLKMAYVHDGDMTDKEIKDLTKAAGAVLPIPYRAIEKLKTAESPAQWANDVVRDPGFIVAGAVGVTALAAWAVNELSKSGQTANAQIAQLVHDETDFKGLSKIQGLIAQTHIPIDEYETQVLIFTESNGDPEIVNSKSGAYGKYQFMPDTWKLIRQKFPNAGLTADGLKTSEEQQELAFRLMTRDNAKILQRKGVEINLNTIYAAHHFGAGDAATLWDMDDDSLLPRSIITSKIRSQNPWFSGENDQVNGGQPVKTVADFKRAINDLLVIGERKYKKAVDVNLD